MKENFVAFELLTVLVALDASVGLWPIEIDKRDHVKTESPSDHGLYRFTGMISVLKTALPNIQRTMTVILTTVRWQLALVQLDYIANISKLPVDHNERVKLVLRLACEATVTINLKSCKCSFKAIDYLRLVTLHNTSSVRSIQPM